eukprot:INCI17879.1.p1 GENE.INCI17879.1~~INCI17879.1.p1  ORF type:complete len:136 (-),score=29.43 INCI17879.1:109-516(-)
MSSKRKKAPLSVKISESATPKEQAGSDGRQVQLSWEGVKAVQKKIERCLELYMTQAEIVTALQAQSNVEPSLTCLVWQKLQEQNPHFFHVYDYYLRLKDHATAFNYLVEQQALIQNDLTPDGPSKKKVVEVDITQ